MTVRRTLLLLLAVAYLAMWSVAIYGWTVLPARFPVHFDAQGLPDRYAAKSFFAWFSLPLLFTVIGAGIASVGVVVERIARRNVQFINVPDRAAFLRLAPAARSKALEPMTDVGFMMPPALAGLSTYIQWASLEVALGRQRELSTFPIVLLLIWSFGAIATGVVRTQRTIRQLSA